MRISSGDAVVFAGLAYLDLNGQNPANLTTYSNLTFNIIDQVSTVVYNNSGVVATSSSTINAWSVPFNSGVLTVRGSYFVELVGSIGSTVQTTFNLSGNAGGQPYLEID